MPRRILLAASVAGVLVVAVGAAYATGVSLPFSGDGNTINGCYTKSEGQLTLLTPSQTSCPSYAIPISWNQTGPAGAQGPAGPQGAQGPQGPPASRAHRGRPARR